MAPRETGANECGIPVLQSCSGGKSGGIVEKPEAFNPIRRSSRNPLFSLGRVLRKFSGPAVLIEAGYLSNKADREVITNQGVKIGKQIGAGIIRYIDRERK
ncbi:MAG: N-acetylmuramoyl-L-alanine amidase [Syntrophaceae bacterium]|nr:N-acetylmuramoyl-L-alanine amidase [Syntrophaceae bacterium]